LRRLRIAAILALVALMAACGSSTGTGTGQTLPESQNQPALTSQPIPVPSGMAVPGKLMVAADPTEAPLVYYDHTNRFAGFSIDLLGEIASEMGLKLGFVNINGSQIVPGFADVAHRYDVGIASQPATAELTSSAATLQYLVGGLAILAGSDQSQISGPGSLCGFKVGADRGSSGETAVLRQNEGNCHNHLITYVPYDDDIKGLKDVRSGALQAYVQDYAVATLFVRLYNRVRLVPHHFNQTPEVFLFALTNTALRDAAAKAFDRLRRKSGAYRSLLNRWGMSEGAVS
jgi:polar amino acid transport system substrate-binding protein